MSFRPPCDRYIKGFDASVLSANDDDKLLLATMMEAAMNTWSIRACNVDNLFAAIAIMLVHRYTAYDFLGWQVDMTKTTRR